MVLLKISRLMVRVIVCDLNSEIVLDRRLTSPLLDLVAFAKLSHASVSSYCVSEKSAASLFASRFVSCPPFLYDLADFRISFNYE